MEALRRIGAIILADLRERSRATRFWVMLAVVAATTWWCFPAQGSGWLTVGIDDARGVYSSAWSGLALGLVYSTMLSWIGFYLVRGTLVRDFDSRVWQLLVATPMTRAGYLLSKWASHMVVFSVVLAVGLAVGLVAQWVRAEDRGFDLWEMAKPVVVLALPSLALTAFFAILFDMVPPLRRTAGNVIYFFVWVALFALMAATMAPEGSEWAKHTALSDPSGIAMVQRELHERLPTLAPGLNPDSISIGGAQVEGQVRLFDWSQWSPKPRDLAGRLAWVLLSMLATVMLAPALDYAASRTSSPASSAQRPGRRLRWLDWLLAPLEHNAAGLLLASELRLMIRQRALWWWAALATCWVVQAVAPAEAMSAAVIVAWMVSLDLFSRSQRRDHDHHTTALLMTSPNAAARVTAARMAATVLIATLSVLPALLRQFAVSPAEAAAMALVAGNVALAGMATAALARSPRPYELLMAFAAYLGVQGAGPLALQAMGPGLLLGHALALPACIAILVLASGNRRPARVAQTP